MTTALILRPKENPPVRVLELDGPKKRYVQRGEGSYYLCTDNQPLHSIMPLAEYPPDPRLTDWASPHWEIYQQHDGSIEVHACRPTEEEIMEGETHGALGSVIRLLVVSKINIRAALQLARILCKCSPDGVPYYRSSFRIALNNAVIETNIPITLE